MARETEKGGAREDKGEGERARGEGRWRAKQRRGS